MIYLLNIYPYYVSTVVMEEKCGRGISNGIEHIKPIYLPNTIPTLQHIGYSRPTPLLGYRTYVSKHHQSNRPIYPNARICFSTPKN